MVENKDSFDKVKTAFSSLDMVEKKILILKGVKL